MSLKIGKIYGIEVRLHYTWIIVFLMVVWSVGFSYTPLQYPGQGPLRYLVVGVSSAVIIFLSVLFHELCHSIVAKRMGIPVPSIVLFLFGGVSQIAEEPREPGEELKMAVIGPLSSLLLAGVFAAARLLSVQLLGLREVAVSAVLQYGFIINLMLGLFNLIPAFPMDGGRVLRAMLWMRSGSLISATRKSALAAEVISYAFIGFGFLSIFTGGIANGMWLIFLGWFIKSGAEASLRHTVIAQALAKEKVRGFMSSPVCTVSPDWSLEEAVNECFYKYTHGGFPVVDEGGLKGILAVEDVRRIPRDRWRDTPVKEAMTPLARLVTVNPEDPASEALIKISKYGIGRLPVVEDGKLIGIITRSDLMRAVKTRIELA
ncbi:MAG: site-2 protease family protein [Candidatus Bathyarchaeia archaeon]